MKIKQVIDKENVSLEEWDIEEWMCEAFARHPSSTEDLFKYVAQEVLKWMLSAEWELRPSIAWPALNKDANPAQDPLSLRLKVKFDPDHPVLLDLDLRGDIEVAMEMCREFGSYSNQLKVIQQGLLKLASEIGDAIENAGTDD